MEFDIRVLAEEKGLKTYDTALPLAWYEDVHTKTGFWPQSYGFVWCYDSPSVWGAPYPLTEAATILLEFYTRMERLAYYLNKHKDCNIAECEFNPEAVSNILTLPLT